MYAITGLILLSTTFCGVVASHLNRAVGGHCTDIIIPVQIQAQNYNLSILPGFQSDPTTLLRSSFLSNTTLSMVPATGSEFFAATYCEPTATNCSRSGTLQLLSHGIAYTRDYWWATSQRYQSDKYSWVEFALAQGYPIFSIDRLGNGQSFRPDPLSTLQVPYETAAAHTLIQAIKSGTANGLPRPFKNVIYVGHSFGSMVGNSLAAEFPHDAAALVLTGFSHELLPALPGFLTMDPFPAALFDPHRFGNLSLGYLVSANKTARKELFYYAGSYDPQLYEVDWATQGTVGLAEIVTLALSITAAPSYRGPVFVMTGNRDPGFCSTGNSSPPDCGSGPGNRLARTAQMFPSAQPYGYYAVPQTGHMLNYHYSARDTFTKAHQFLESAGL